MKEKKECPYCHNTNTRSNGSQGKEVASGAHVYDSIWYICNDCKAAGRSPFNFPEYHKRKPKPKIEYADFDRTMAYKLFNDVKQVTKHKETAKVNAYTNTVMTAEHIAVILGIEYDIVLQWFHNPLPKIKYVENDLVEYIKTQENSILILNLLGFAKTPMNLTFIPFFLTKKQRMRKETGKPVYPDEWDMYREKTDKIKWFRGLLVNEISINEFTCREDAIVVLGAILRCHYADLLSATYKDFAYDK